MQFIDRFFRYFSVAFFGFVALITLFSTVVILSHRDGVLGFLLGA